MRISRRTKKESPTKAYLLNESIVAPEVMVLDDTGKNIGVLKTFQAIGMAREQGFDLVLINPKSEPPVAKYINFGQFRYQQEKEARLAKAHQHVVETKGVRLSLRIGKHDEEVRQTQALKFLNNGDKVKIEVILRGREMQQGALAFEIIKKFVANINAIAPIRWEQEATRQGNKITAIVTKA